MINKQRLEEIKSLVEDHIGQKVDFEVEKGKKRARQNSGIIETASNDIFTIKVDKGLETEHCTSFSYTELLIEHVEIVLAETGERLMN